MVQVTGPDGKVYNFNQEQAYQLAQRGLGSIMQTQQETSTPAEPEIADSELSLEDKFTNLENRYNDMQTEKTAAEQLTLVNKQFTENAAKYDLTRDHPGAADIIHSSALAYLTLKPGTDVNTLYKNLHDRLNNVVQQMVEIEKKKLQSQSFARNYMHPVERSAGSTPAVNSKPKMTAKDLKSGAVREAFIRDLEQMDFERME